MIKMMQANKKLLALLGIMALMLCLTACEEDDDKDSGPIGTANLQVTPGTLKFGANGGTQRLTIKTTYDYFGFKVSADWLNGDFEEGVGNDYITITAEPNPTTSPRTATVRVNGSEDGKTTAEFVTINVEQEGKSGSASPDMVYTTVSQKGGEVSAGDITVDFPSGTFNGEVSVGVSKQEKGTVLGEDEVSEFYQLEMPVDSKQPFKISIKAEKSDDIQMMVHAPSVAMCGNMEQGESDLAIEATYANGAYTAEIPAFDNQGESGNGKVSFGLAKRASGTRTATTRGTTNSSNIKYHLEWSRRRYYSLEAEEIIDNAARNAINTILSLGFKVSGTRDIPIVIKELSEDGAYGYFMQSALSEKWSTIEINSNMLNGNKNELQQTVYHEMLHYFQSAYDPRCCFSKYRNVYRDLLMLSEAGGVWIEKLAGDNSYSDIMKNNADGVMRSFAPVKEIYTGTPNEGREYQAHGYGLGIVLEYLSQEQGNNSIVSLYQAQKDGAATTKECIEKFKELAGFDFFEHYEDFATQVITGKLIDGFGFANIRESSQLTLTNDQPQKVTGKVYPYGVKIKQVRVDKIYKDSKGSNSMKDKAFIAEEKKSDTYTYVYLQNRANKDGKELGRLYKGDTFIYDDENELNKFMNSSTEGNSYFYLVTFNLLNYSTSESELEVALAEVKIPNITKMSIYFGYTDTSGNTASFTLPKRSTPDTNTGILGVDEWLPVTTKKNVSDKTVTITASSPMPYREYSSWTNEGTQTMEVSITLDVENWRIKRVSDLERHKFTGSVKWSGTNKTTWGGTGDWQKYDDNISFSFTNMDLFVLNGDDGDQHLTEFGDTFDGSPFSSLTNTSLYTSYRAPHGEGEQEKYEYANYSYPINSSRTSVINIYLWEEDD